MLSPSARADPPALAADLSCERVAAPGRVVCQLTANATSGKLVWSDVLVVRAPGFARPLRSRVVAAASEPGVAAAKLALVATEPGSGTLEVLLRGVVCRAGPSGESCASEVLAASAAVEVGPAAPPPAQ